MAGLVPTIVAWPGEAGTVVGLLRKTNSDWLPSSRVSFVMGTAKVRVTTPGAKVSVPAVAV